MENTKPQKKPANEIRRPPRTISETAKLRDRETFLVCIVGRGGTLARSQPQDLGKLS